MDNYGKLAESYNCILYLTTRMPHMLSNGKNMIVTSVYNCTINYLACKATYRWGVFDFVRNERYSPNPPVSSWEDFANLQSTLKNPAPQLLMQEHPNNETHRLKL